MNEQSQMMNQSKIMKQQIPQMMSQPPPSQMMSQPPPSQMMSQPPPPQMMSHPPQQMMNQPDTVDEQKLWYVAAATAS
ncbi:unnamed protein product [Rhodiola kirilowii]